MAAVAPSWNGGVTPSVPLVFARVLSDPTSAPDGAPNRSYNRRPTTMCCHNGTGRISSTTTSVSPLTSRSQAPNSSALDTVADSPTTCTSGGRCRITSSQTAPRNRSAR